MKKYFFILFITTFALVNLVFASNNCNMVFRKALRAQVNGNHKTAITYLRKYASICGKDVVYNYLMGESYFLLKSYYKAFKHYLSIPGADPRYGHLRKRMLKLAKYYLTPEQYAELVYPVTKKMIEPKSVKYKK